MRYPLKFNRAYWPKWLGAFLPIAEDPTVLCREWVSEDAFTRAISSLQFGETWKTTQKDRFPKTIIKLSKLDFVSPPVILDVGASDGSTSLDIMRFVPFGKFFITDRYIKISYKITDAATWFYDDLNVCILIVTDKLVIYPNANGACLLFKLISKFLFSRAPKVLGEEKNISLVRHDVQNSNDNIIVAKHNIFDVWPGEKVDLIIAANILNKVYFTENEIVLALRNLHGALKDNGRIAIIDNRPHERSTIFRFHDDVVTLEKRVNGGTEIESIVLKYFLPFS